MTAKPCKGFAVFDNRGSLLWGTLADSAAEAESRFRRWNPAAAFPEQFSGYSTQPVTVLPDAPPSRRPARCKDTADLFEG